MTQKAASVILPAKRSRAARLPVLTVVMTFAIAVAAEAFSPMPAIPDALQGLESASCTPALTIGLASAGKTGTGTWLQLVKSDGVTACAAR
jgi:hypothetical protein